MINLHTTDDRKLNNLRGAICDYLDDGKLVELAKDLRFILNDEKEKFKKMARHYDIVLNCLQDFLLKACESELLKRITIGMEDLIKECNEQEAGNGK